MGRGESPAAPLGCPPFNDDRHTYREHRVLGRLLRLEEMTYVTEVVRRLKALLMMGDDLDANYRPAAEMAMDRAVIESGKS